MANTLRKIVILSTFFSSFNALGVDTCSRIAIINHQEVLVDTTSTQKGEGLRYHLEKDPKAKMYLDKYQEGTQLKWQTAALGTVGTGLLIAGLTTSSTSQTKKALMLGGVSVIFINFLVAKTLENVNEVHLLQAIKEYNKRNLPRIEFKQEDSQEAGRNPSNLSISLEKTWEF